MSSNSPNWYVLRALFRSELKVRDGLRRAGFRCFVPMCWQMETIRGHKQRRLVPAIRGLVFVYGNADDIGAYKNSCKDIVYWMMTTCSGSREKLTVSDKAMADFIQLTEQTERKVIYFRPDELQLGIGDRIVIHGGTLDGVEGSLLKVKGKREKQLVVAIDGIVAAAVTLRPEMVELVKIGHGHIDREWTAHELQRLSLQMLTSPPDIEHSKGEWEMLYHEIRTQYDALYGLKGFLPSLEGEMALALLMAEVALAGSISQELKLRYDTAVAKLRAGSRLKTRMQQIVRILSDNPSRYGDLLHFFP